MLDRRSLVADPQEPLTRACLGSLDETWVERILMWVPLAGWSVCHFLWTRKARPVRRTINAILAARRPPELPLAHQAVMDEVCRIAKEECGWPAPRFLLDDELAVVFWSGEDWLDGDQACAKVADLYGLRDEQVEDLVFGRPGTIRDLAELVLGGATARCSETPTP